MKEVTINTMTYNETGNSEQNSEAFYEQFIGAIDIPFYTLNAEGKLTFYNEAAADLWGRSPLLGNDLWNNEFELLNPDGTMLEIAASPVAVCFRERRPVTGQEVIIVRPDGSRRHVISHPQPLFDNDGKLKGIVNLLEDVTAIRQAEKKIREYDQHYNTMMNSVEKKIEERTRELLRRIEEQEKNEERFHRMVEEVEDYAIILLDKDGLIQNWNRGAEKIKGYTEQEIIGKSFEIFYSEEDRKNKVPQTLIRKAATEGKATTEGWRIRKDGSRFWGSIVITALHDSKGALIGFTKVTRDLTERKIADDKLKSYSAELEFRNTELEQFTYVASHDMKEPVRKIQLYASHLKSSPHNQLDQRSSDFLDRLMKAAVRMNNLIEDLLAYSRTTSVEENFVPVDLNEIITEAAASYKEEFLQKEVAFVAGSLPMINGIPFQIKQLVDNLINNALKYSDPTRKPIIKISGKIVSEQSVPNVPHAGNDKYVLISFCDNGIGFEQEYADKIFGVFQRLEVSSETTGSGIGLAICKKIVQNHNGYIWAYGEKNNGARFDIYLPVLKVKES
ncbi:PAS domain-containing sensor histidine kinase [Taibaiella soli]|uniref:histidine kinase n=1 Tax=Taibaiella soli TaxID=1649169 RepID=A0A2W2A6Y9_9BACT|nr:PAS domain S-box protein [Taibaiella soli]PZF70981.1 PAS domain-containing sensor histidine kinase [Taibaiella soli]